MDETMLATPEALNGHEAMNEVGGVIGGTATSASVDRVSSKDEMWDEHRELMKQYIGLKGDKIAFGEENVARIAALDRALFPGNYR
jgi:hypothetical protein